MDKLSTAYLESVSQDGLWPYLPNNKESLESTCWCAVACRQNAKLSQRTISRLLELQNSDGGWSEEQGSKSDWATATALLAMSILQRNKDVTNGTASETIAKALERGFQCLVGLRTDMMSDFGRVCMMVVQGPDFDYPRGWPWEPDTYNWIEPTAYALLAIKSAKLHNDKRYKKAVEQAQLYMLQKTCKPAGWNFGAPRTLGTDWPPTPPPTALAVISLQDVKDEKVDAATECLKNMSGPAVDTTLADALRMLARDTRGEDMSKSVNSFVDRYRKRDHEGENLLSLAAAVIVSRLPHDGNPFKLGS